MRSRQLKRKNAIFDTVVHYDIALFKVACRIDTLQMSLYRAQP